MKRFSAGSLLSVAKVNGVEALIHSKRFQDDLNRPFEWDTFSSPVAFLNNGSYEFEREYPYEFWLLQGNKALIGTLGDRPAGLYQGKFIAALCSVTPTASMRAISTLGNPRHFTVYTGPPAALVEEARYLQ